MSSPKPLCSLDESFPAQMFPGARIRYAGSVGTVNEVQDAGVSVLFDDQSTGQLFYEHHHFEALTGHIDGDDLPDAAYRQVWAAHDSCTRCWNCAREACRRAVAGGREQYGDVEVVNISDRTAEPHRSIVTRD